jgi:hypothetical protein
MKTAFFISVVFFFVTSVKLSFSQHDSIQQNLNSDSKIKSQTIIFNDIESGILTNDVKKISMYFSPQPYISLINGVNGYYSSNQAYYILEDFFTTYKVVSFKIGETKNEESVSYGKGDYYFEKKGKREVAHLYVTLSKTGSKWHITQISIN